MIHATRTAKMPAASAGGPPVNSPTATPPKAACAMPVVANASRRRKTKNDSTEHSSPVTSPATRARRMKA